MRRVTLCVAAVSLALLAGCGGDDDESSSDSGATGTSDALLTDDTTTETTTEETTTEETTTDSGNTDTGSREEFNDMLFENLTGEQGLTDEQANCVLDRLDKTLSDSQVEQLLGATNIQSPEDLDPEIQQIVFDAGAACAS